MRLDGVEHVARELGKIYRECRSGTLSASEGTKLTFILRSIADLREGVLFARRLAALEAAQHDLHVTR